jgi:dihydroorotate dehydrogenase electron transfer subunit
MQLDSLLPTQQSYLLPRPFAITDIKSENAYTKTFILDGALTAQPGQFVMAWLPGHEDKPFSLANADPISLTVAAVGPFSRALHELRVGQAIWLRGPLGRGFHLEPISASDAHILLVGGGYGVAPLFFLARQTLAKNYQVSMIIGARSAPYLMMVEAFEASGAAVWVTTEDGSAGIPGRVTDAMSVVLANPERRPAVVCACGPTAMLQAVARQCDLAGLPIQLAWEAYMRCGIGLCGSCEVGPGWLTCLDGPVFGFDPTQVRFKTERALKGESIK